MVCYYSHAKNLPKIGLLLGVQKTLSGSVWSQITFSGTTFAPCMFYIYFMLYNYLLYPLNSLFFFLYFKYSWTPYPCFKSDKSFHAQLKNHSFFLAPIPYSFLDLVEECLLFFLLHKLLKSRNQVLITFGFPKVICVVAYLQQLLVINKCSNELDRIKSRSVRMGLWMSDILMELEYYRIRDLKTQLSCDLD